jgi:hypothetical protein
MVLVLFRGGAPLTAEFFQYREDFARGTIEVVVDDHE